MIIKTNTGKELEILEKDLVVKDNKLYNKSTKLFEAIEGDRISFTTMLNSGHKVITSGNVDKYTYNGKIYLMGVVLPYNAPKAYEVEHIVKIVDYTDDNAVVAQVSFADWKQKKQLKSKVWMNELCKLKSYRNCYGIMKPYISPYTGLKVMSLNRCQSPAELPDSGYIDSYSEFFPGTILECKIYLSKENVESSN